MLSCIVQSELSDCKRIHLALSRGMVESWDNVTIPAGVSTYELKKDVSDKNHVNIGVQKMENRRRRKY